MLTTAERLVTAALATLLGAGCASAATVAPPPPVAPLAAPAPVPTAAAVPPAEPSAEPSPVPPPPPAPPAPVVVQAAPAGPLPAPPEPPQEGCPLPKRRGGPFTPKPLKAPVVPDEALPAPLAAGTKAGALDVVSGKGFWLTNFAETPVDVAGTVAKARAAGMRSIWVRTGGRQGYYGDRFLPRLVPAAHEAGIAVVAWDFPFLSDPVADADRARLAYADGVDAFAPDIETTFEGVHASARRVELYLSIVRAHAGTRPVAATVPRPTPSRRESFPYSSFPAYADLFVPMVYWSCNEPGALVEQSLRELGALLPVAPVGQAYDMGEEGGRPGLPTRAETWRFLDAARRGGAVGASLWTVERMGAGQLEALTAYPWPATG